jgi:acetylornithine deacetylase/succinyl-diaminopimelate desuccinylase-like protein
MDNAKLMSFVDTRWDKEVVPTLVDYIKIPNKSPQFDREWVAHGHMERAVALFERWARAKIAALPGATLEVVRLPERTPVILIEVPGTGRDCALLYGHLDKQPEMVGWSEGLGPWTPVLKGDKLYGRGGADDGYAMFGALTALSALKEQGIPHARAVVLIEASEESGSIDLPAYIEHLAPRLGKPTLVVCLDSGCGNYEQLWLTTSLRGMVSGTLTVRVLEEGVHSGDASGVVPSSVRLLRQVLSRLEDETSGEIKLSELYVQVPPERVAQAGRAAQVLGQELYARFPFTAGAGPVTTDLTELVLNRSWRPQLAITGMEGLPNVANAGNVLLPYATAKLSLRIPPTLDARKAGELVRETLEAKPPNGAAVKVSLDASGTGWNAPATAPWLEQSLSRASEAAFGKPPAYMGEGGSIPFMAMLGERFPHAQFVITGVLGPHANAHGPNEFLHIPTGKRVTAAVAHVLKDHLARAG